MNSRPYKTEHHLERRSEKSLNKSELEEIREMPPYIGNERFYKQNEEVVLKMVYSCYINLNYTMTSRLRSLIRGIN